MRLRTLGPADAAAFQQLRLQALREDPVAFASSYEDERNTPLTVVEDRLASRPDRAIVGAFDAGSLVGLAAWHREELRKLQHQGFVWGVYIAVTHRGCGLARRLLEVVIALARRADGIRQLDLTAYAHNTTALAVYESLGFVAYGRELGAVCINGVVHDDVHMALRL
jgi:ribosomal protein S18 acetylase RimI-like enzyme